MKVFHVIKKILNGERYTVSRFARNSSVDAEVYKEALDQLVEDGVLIKLTENQYVLDDVDEDYALQKIRKASAQIEKNMDDTTKVKVSGSLMDDDVEFETDKDPSELL